MVALLRYGSGFPFNRLEKLEGNLGVPLPASTQWEMVQQCAQRIEPAHTELITEGAQGKVLHNDDTPMRILGLADPPEAGSMEEGAQEPSEERTGIFTSGIISIGNGHRIALFSDGASFLRGFERDWVVLGEGRKETPLTELDEQVRGGVDSLLWQNSKENPIVAETAS